MMWALDIIGLRIIEHDSQATVGEPPQASNNIVRNSNTIICFGHDVPAPDA
jgi:hypothetical protein